MSALKNLTILKRDISRRLRQALQELQDALRNVDGVPVPARVPVPVRVPRRAAYSQFTRLGTNARFGAGYGSGSPFYRSTRFYSTYSSRFNNFSGWRWSRINNLIMFQNFSSRGQFRLKLFSTFYRVPSLTELLRKKSAHAGSLEPTQVRRTAFASVPMANVLSSLRLNILLTQRFHDMVMDLARPATADGCYLDFKLQPKLLVPASTMMSGEVLGELLVNLKHFELHIRELQRDLARLAELGELPLKVLGDVIRVYFPNCDRDKLEQLLVEKNVVGGVIFEDFAREGASLEQDDAVTLVSDFDVLSSCNMLSLVSSESNYYDDVLSSSCGTPDDRIVRLEPLDALDHVEIAEDDYCWT